MATQERVICASPDYVRIHGEPRTLEDVRSHRCIVGAPKGPPLVWHVLESGVEKRFTPPGTRQLSDGESMVDAAVGGLGLCQLPISLVPVLSDYSTVPIGVHVVWPRRVHLSPRVRYVVDQLVASAVAGRLSRSLKPSVA